MKAKYFLIVLLLVSFSAFAQETKVPKAVKDSFSKLYPSITEVKWDKENMDFEASFKHNGKDMSVIFDKEGKALETESVIEIAQLPDGVDKYVLNNFGGYKITEAAKIIKSTGEVLFEAEVSRGKDKKDLLFDSKGRLEKKDTDSEDEHDEENED